MWEIYEHRRARKELDELPAEILKRYEKWKDVVRISGPAVLRVVKGLRDESLRGEWRGHRCSRLNQQYRVNYRIDREQVFVEVVGVTAHDHRRK